MDRYENYESPLVTRNASAAMCRLFGSRKRIRTWRELWVALADGQRRQGLAITKRQVDALRQAIDDIDFRAAAAYERKIRHDVMAHVHAFGDRAPQSRGILHLGATSAYVTDNADLIIMRGALHLIRDWLVNVIDALARFAREHRMLPTLGMTHGQPAQVTTVGKRAVLWCYDFVRDLEEIETRLDRLSFRGVKGTTGTQASFLDLFDGDHDKVLALEADVAGQFDFKRIEPVTGQTYSRKVDAQIICALAGVASSVHKMCNDLRLLASTKEIEEPFERAQVGSSAMAYKRNPMRCERATALARFVLALPSSALQTHAEQWFERTLDDSANRRLTIPESFLATDGMLRIMLNVSRGLVVYPKVIAQRLDAELPFMATEAILMAGVQAGGDRQKLHEKIRRHSQAAARRVKEDGAPNDLLDRLINDSAFAKIDIRRTTSARLFIGRSPQQVDAFLKDIVTPLRRRHRSSLGMDAELSV